MEKDKFVEKNRNEEDQFKESFKMYKKVLEEHPEIVQAMKDKPIKKILAYELKIPLNEIIKLNYTIKNDLCRSNEEKMQAFDMINGFANLMGDLIEVISFEELTKKEFKKNSELIILEKIVREHANIYDKYMKKERIGLHLKYNRMPYDKSIEIYANKAIINTIWGTLFRNSFAWTPSLSNITQVFRINKMNNLEIIMENAYADERVRGNKEKKEGIGIPFVKNVIGIMGGNFQTYNTISQIQKDYDMQEWHGYKKSRNPDQNQDIFGIKIAIPMRELIKTE
jgi:hypothetical protein